ncbi:MAG: oligosaccharide flippase family protein [Erythrobacter sp.]
MWDRIQRNASLSFASIAAVAIFGFASMYFNTRALGVDGFGIYAALIALSLMLDILAGMQSWQAILALSDGRGSRIFGAALLVNVALAIVGTLIGILLLAVLDFGGGWAAFVLIGTQVLRISDPLIGLLRKHDHFGFIALARSLTALATFVMAAVYWYLAVAIELYLLTFATLQIGHSALLAIKCSMVARPKKPHRQDVKDVLKFCIPTGLSGAIGAIRQRGLYVLLGATAGVGAVGIYAVADRIAALAQMGYRAIFEAVFREMPTAKRPRKLALGIAAIAAPVAVLLLAATYFLGGPIVEGVAGAEFTGAAPVLTLLVGAIAITIVTLGLRAWLIVKIGPTASLGCNVFAMLALLAAPSLISGHGVAGAAITQILFEALWCIALVFVIIRSGKMRAVDDAL